MSRNVTLYISHCYFMPFDDFRGMSRLGGSRSVEIARLRIVSGDRFDLTRYDWSDSERVWDMKISDSERLILLMLCEIHQALKIKDGFDADFLSKALIDGHAWAIRHEYSHVLPREDDPAEMVKEVQDILDMWRVIETSYGELDPAGKKALEDAVPIFGKNPTFDGFDGNNETEHMSIYQFLVEDMGRWSEFKGRDKNSHMPLLPNYQRMLSVFGPMRSKMLHLKLSLDQLAEVLGQMAHPTS